MKTPNELKQLAKSVEEKNQQVSRVGIN